MTVHILNYEFVQTITSAVRAQSPEIAGHSLNLTVSGAHNSLREAAIRVIVYDARKTQRSCRGEREP